MKAVILTSNGTQHFSDFPETVLRPDECRIKIKAAGVCSSDIPRVFDHGAYHYPLIMGHEFSGEVTECASQVEPSIQVGDRVCVFPLLPCHECEMCHKGFHSQCINYDYYGSRRNGAYAEFLNVKSWNILKLPQEVSYEHGACMEPLSVVVHGVKRLKLTNNSNVCIIGAGFLGLIALKYLKFLNPLQDVTIIDRNQFKLDIAKKFGANTLRIANQQDWEDYLNQNHSKFSCVLESCGVPLTYKASLKLIAPKGNLVWMGNISSDLMFEKKEISSILRKEINILGTWNSIYKSQENSDWDEAIQILSKGFKITDLITHKIKLQELPSYISDLHEVKTGKKNNVYIKVMVCPLD